MRLRSILEDDDAVSPVIGVILMVAITVILAAVIASFVLGLGPSGDNQPTASFGFDYDGSSELKITHENGDQIKTSELFIRGDGVSNKEWPVSDASSTIGSQTAVSSGDSTTLTGVPDDYDVSVVWESDENSATLSSDTGPGA